MSGATSSAWPLQRWLGMGRSASFVAFVGFLAGAAFDANALFIVNQPWVKPGTRSTEAYMVLTSTEGATLIGVRSSIAARVSLRGAGAHRPARAALALPAGAAVALRPGADRIVLTGLTCVEAGRARASHAANRDGGRRARGNHRRRRSADRVALRRGAARPSSLAHSAVLAPATCGRAASCIESARSRP